jgi:phosphoserine phosphatase RsbU/P
VSLSRILIVDDEPRMIRSVERVLCQDYKTATTRSSREAIALASAFKPDLAILDVQMPELDGFDLMEQLRAIDPEMDVIFMTGSIHELDSKLIRAVRKDAFYFLQKPFDRELLLALVDRCLKLKRLDRENRRHLHRLEKELAEARAFQQGLLPPESGKIGRVSVFARYIPCFELAGDFFDYAAAGANSAALIVADVPGSVVERVSNGIRAFRDLHFITLICARIGNGNVEYVNAGHPPGILLNREASTVLLEATGPLISPAFAKSSWSSHTIPVRDKTRLVLFTDGVIEAGLESGGYGLDRLVATVARSSERGDLLLEEILEGVTQFAAGRPIHDDVTLVAADF